MNLYLVSQPIDYNRYDYYDAMLVRAESEVEAIDLTMAHVKMKNCTMSWVNDTNDLNVEFIGVCNDPDLQFAEILLESFNAG